MDTGKSEGQIRDADIMVCRPIRRTWKLLKERTQKYPVKLREGWRLNKIKHCEGCVWTWWCEGANPQERVVPCVRLSFRWLAYVNKCLFFKSSGVTMVYLQAPIRPPINIHYTKRNWCERIFCINFHCAIIWWHLPGVAITWATFEFSKTSR